MTDTSVQATIDSMKSTDRCHTGRRYGKQVSAVVNKPARRTRAVDRALRPLR